MLASARMVELLQTSDTSTDRDREVAESLSALLNGGGSKKKTPSVRHLPNPHGVGVCELTASAGTPPLTRVLS